MAEYFAGGHLRYLDGEWRDDNGDVVKIKEDIEAQIIECEELHICGNCGRTLPYNKNGKEILYWVCNYCHWCGYKLKGGIF